MRFSAGLLILSCLLAGFAIFNALPVYASGPLFFSKTFSHAAVGQGELARLTYRIDNTANFLEVSSLAFTDKFPAGMVVQRPLGSENNQGGIAVAR